MNINRPSVISLFSGVGGSTLDRFIQPDMASNW